MDPDFAEPLVAIYPTPRSMQCHMMGKNFRHALCYDAPGSGRAVMPLESALTHAVQLSLVYQSSSRTATGAPISACFIAPSGKDKEDVRNRQGFASLNAKHASSV